MPTPHAARTSLAGALFGVGAVVAGAASQSRLRFGPRRWRHTRGFYEQHAPQPGHHGEVLAAEPLQAYLLPGLRLRARAWRVLYRSSNLADEPTTVSGTILVPRGRRPVGLVAYAPGTHGLANYSAPSRLIARGLDWETAFVANELAHGHAVVMTDYEGLGTPGDHPYVIGRTIGRNVLDALRAALSFVPAQLDPDIPIGIMGYSEGGNASAWAAELHPVYAPELGVVACASGSIPADLETAGENVDGSVYAFFGGYGALGLNAAYPALDLGQYLTPEGEHYMYRLRRSSVVTAAVRGPHFVGFEAMTTENPLHIPEWQARMRENKLGRHAPTVPVYLYTSVRDHLVEPSQTRDLAMRWRARGADVHLQEVPAVDHITGFLLGGFGASRWLAARLRQAAQDERFAERAVG
ncbi:MAG TPA: lipase family protein [Aeromicrobium sp.]|nr:lipase family protein [Aeromicrobium sp.]